MRDLARRYLPDLVYGANDGIITTFAVVSGVVGASLSNRIILILGFANLVADGVSMGASNYLARRSEAGVPVDPARRVVLRNAVATFVGFVTAGVVPLSAYLVPLPDSSRYGVAIALTLSTLFFVGAGRALVRDRGFVRSGLEMLVVGAGAAALAFGVGALAAELTDGR